MQVKVHAEVLDILTGSRDTTNEFYFVFDSGQPDLPQVVPRTYAGQCICLGRSWLNMAWHIDLQYTVLHAMIMYHILISAIL